MAKQQIKVGFTDYTTLVFIPDPASTDGSGKTGLVAANLTVSGVRVETDNDVTVTDYTASLNDLAALTTAHTDWGLKEVSSTLAPGLYRLDIADAIFASGAWSAVVYVMITSSAAAASPMEFTLVAYDINDGVRMGLTALPNAAADAAGGLAISDAGGLDLDARLDAAVSSRMATYTQPTGFLAATFPAGTIANTTNITAGTITTVTNLTNAPTAGDLTATMKTSVTTAATAATPVAASVTGAVGSVTAAVTVGTNNDKTGYAIAVGGIGATAFAAGAIDAAAIAANAIGASELAQDAAREIADEVLDRDLAGGASGGSRNVRNALRSLRNKVAIAAGTLTVYQEDDSTSAWTAAVTTAAGDPIDSIDPA